MRFVVTQVEFAVSVDDMSNYMEVRYEDGGDEVPALEWAVERNWDGSFTVTPTVADMHIALDEVEATFREYIADGVSLGDGSAPLCSMTKETDYNNNTGTYVFRYTQRR